jgi:hypothetical protein
MTLKKVFVIVSAGLGAGLAIVALWFGAENRKLRRDLADLRIADEEMRARPAKAARPQIAPEELARLKAAEAEMLRLRSEIGRLRRELAQGGPVQQQQRLAGGPATSATAEVPNGAFQASFNARIPEGQTLAFGDWTTETGNRAVALIHPTVLPGGTNASQVLVRTTLLEVPQEVWNEIGLTDIKSDPQLGSRSSLVSRDQAENLVAGLTNRPGCFIASRPTIQTTDGEQANLFVGETTPSGQQVGQSLSVLPQLGDDGKTVDLSVTMEFTPRPSTTNGSSTSEN